MKLSQPCVIQELFPYCRWANKRPKEVKWYHSFIHPSTHPISSKYWKPAMCQALQLNQSSAPSPGRAGTQTPSCLPVSSRIFLSMQLHRGHSVRTFSDFFVSKDHVGKWHIFTVGQQLQYFICNDWHSINVLNRWVDECESNHGTALPNP